MPEPVVGGSIILAGAGMYGANKAADAADRADARALAFEQKKYDDWKALYGGIEKNLAKYYENLSPDYYEVRGVEAFEKEKEAALTKIRETFQQRGIRPDSSLALSTEAALEMTAAVQRADIRAGAEQEVMEAKQSFLGLGVQRDPSNNMSRLLQSQAESARADASAASAAAGEALGTAIMTTATGLSDYFRDKKAGGKVS